MSINPKEAQELLEIMAFHEAADSSQAGIQHGTRIGRIAVNSWQAEMIRKSQSVATAETPQALRDFMAAPGVAVIFLPQSAMVTAESIERICRESSLDKVIIWETDQ